ncbi:MAG: CHASE3 domain-containing protein [bacterium]
MKTNLEEGRRWTPRFTAGVVCLSIALFLVANALASLQAAVDLLHIRDGVARTHESIEELQHVETLVKDADIEARGYALTGQPEFLEPHRTAVARIQSRLRVLKAMAASDPDPLSRLQELEQLVVDRIDLSTRQIELQETEGRQAAAHQALATGDTRFSMNQIRRVLHGMVHQERVTLEQRKAEAAEATRVAATTFLTVNVIALIVLLLAYFLAVSYLGRRERARAQIQKAYNELEERVRKRTADLARVNEELNKDIELRKKMAEEREELVKKMMAALAEVKTLSGLLPMCSRCKSIRDDGGYWKRIEAYVSEHSDAEFSHGLCPKCAAELYPDIFGDKT